MLEREFRLPVVVESDRNAFVAGEVWRGAARNCKDVVFLAVGTGIGAGILADGRLIRGHDNLAGAVGWMAVRDQFLPVYASQGCLESEVAGPGIARTARARFGRAMSAEELVERARRGNKEAQRILGEVGRHLGLGLANLVSTLNPRVIVLGGGVAHAGDLLLPWARKTMRQWGQPLAVRQVRVVRSQLGPQAALLGLAKLAFEHFDSLNCARNS
jgi:glucokinase